MTLVRRWPKSPHISEHRSYRCIVCGAVETFEQGPLGSMTTSLILYLRPRIRITSIWIAPKTDHSSMARAPTQGKSTLEARFRFADSAFPGATEGWNSQLRFAAGIADREHYLLRLFKKSGTALDEDLKRLIAGGLRRVRRVLSSRRARQLLVEVLEIVEDQNELGILMIDPGSPICGSSQRVRAR